MNFNVIIQTEGDFKTGLGHLSRCLSLAAALRKKYKKMKVYFLLPPHSYVKGLKRAHFPYRFLKTGGQGKEALATIQILKKYQAHLLITDSYRLSETYYSTLRENLASVPVLAFDDFGEKAKFPVYGFINANLSSNVRLYPPLLLPHSCVGSTYFPLKQEFLKLRPKTFPKTQKCIENIGLIFGSSDPEGQTLRFLKILSKISSLKRINCVVGPLNRGLEEIRKTAERDKRISVFFNPPQIGKVFCRSALIITAGGTTCHEIAYLGIPMAVLVTAPNQVQMARAAECLKIEFGLGNFKDHTDDFFLKKIQKILRLKSSTFRAISKHAKELVDGHGALRIADFIHTTLENYHRDLFSTQEVFREYEKSSHSEEEFSKVKWGSPEGMLNRFKIADRVIRFRKVRSWLDVGSGTGAFLEEVGKKIKILKFRGIDLSPSLIKFARSKKYNAKNVVFKRQNFMKEVDGAPFNLLTAIGVLQKCGVPFQKALARFAELVRPGGQIFLTTKHKDWRAFQDPKIRPYSGHHWFSIPEIRKACLLAGLKIFRLKGFDPKSGKDLSLKNAHSFYLLLQKE